MLEGPTVEEFEIEIEGGRSRIVSRRAPEQLVRAGDPVITLSAELLAQVIGAEPDPDKGVFVAQRTELTRSISRCPTKRSNSTSAFSGTRVRANLIAQAS